jgi:hypothetical protein
MSRYEEILDHLGFLLIERDIIVQDLTPEQVIGLEEIHRKYPVIDKKNLPQLLKILQIILKLRINIDKLEANCIKTLERRDLLKTQLKTETPIINTPNTPNVTNNPATISTTEPSSAPTTEPSSAPTVPGASQETSPNQVPTGPEKP